MKNIDFFSDNSYLFLPTISNPRVALAIDNKDIVQNSFKLYNPFSTKAKVLKSVALFLSALLKYLSIVKKYTKSSFIETIEKIVNQEVVSSIYYATDKDKVVLQIQEKEDKHILGYVKLALNEDGNKKISTETKAIRILKDKHIVTDKYIIHEDSFHGNNFVFLKELVGNIVDENSIDIVKILKKLTRDKKYLLKDHPRIINLRKQLIKLKKEKLLNILDDIVNKSKEQYHLVYEHGDFAPWNIMKVKDDFILFDFEYFIEDGLEYMDMIKYHFQVESLLHQKSMDSVYFILKDKVDIKEFDILFSIFCIYNIVTSCNNKQYHQILYRINNK